MNQTLPRNNKGELITYAWPGGYPVYYLCADGGTLCPNCAIKAEKENLTNDPDDKQWNIIAATINWEDDHMVCDHCNQQIESAYGDPKKENADE